MVFYRLYFMDRGGHIFGLRLLAADDERQVLSRAERMGPGEVRELWRNGTMLKHWDA